MQYQGRIRRVITHHRALFILLLTSMVITSCAVEHQSLRQNSGYSSGNISTSHSRSGYSINEVSPGAKGSISHQSSSSSIRY